LAGLVRYPEALPRHVETLARARLGDGHARLLDALLDAAESGQPLESGALAAHLSGRQLGLPTPEDYDRIPFPFVLPQAERDAALAALDTAIAILIEGPELDAAIAAATDRFDFEEQTRLRLRKAELDQQRKELMRR
jgi:DNA primase